MGLTKEQERRHGLCRKRVTALEVLEHARILTVAAQGSSVDRIATIRSVYQQWQVMIDTHTADGVKVALEFTDSKRPMVVLETAQPAKFPDSIREALSVEPERPAELEGIEDLPRRVEVMDPDVEAIKRFIAERV